MKKRRCNIIAPNIVIPFDGNHADIPSGYTRETSLDGKYPKGTADSTDPNDTGGASTHSHTSASHTHTMVNHTHTYSLPSGGDTVSDGHDSGGSNYSDDTHSHTGTSGAVSGGSISGAATIGNGSNDPAYYTVIFIKASGYTTIPNNAMVFSAATSRSGLAFHTASANRFLKGAGTGANAGTTGGTINHTHTYNHTHSAVNHSHAAANSGAADRPYAKPEGGDLRTATATHVHSVTLASSASGTVNTVSASFTSADVEPAHTTLNAFKNESGSSKMPAVGDIALWLGTLATIPVGWKLCDGTNDTPDMRGRYCKNPSSASASATGGANTHTHSGVASHAHTATGTHTHTGSCAQTTTPYWESGSGHNRSKNTHIHSVSSVASRTATWNSTTISTNEVSNEPEYRTVAFIQFKFPPVMPNPILKMLIDTVENWG